MIALLLVGVVVQLVAATYDGGWNPNYCCYPVPEVCCLEPQDCPSCMDIAFAVDRSVSIGNALRDIVVPFIKKFATEPRWTIGQGANEYQIGMLVFGSEVQVKWNWASPITSSPATFLIGLDDPDMSHTEGLTATSLAFKTLREQIVGGPNNRPGCLDICIMITDGEETVTNGLNLTQEVLLTHETCDKTIVIGVSNAIRQRYVETLASSLRVAFHELDITNLTNLYYTISDILCSLTPQPNTDCCPYTNPYAF